MRRTLIPCLLMILMIGTVSCRAVSTTTPSTTAAPTVMSTPTVVPTTTSLPMEEAFPGFWDDYVYAWLDKDANGFWDEGEIGLPGVHLNVTGPGISNTLISDAEGKAHLSAHWISRPGELDPEGELVVHPTVPPGYRLTTVPRLPTTHSGPLQFGFVLDVPAPTPDGGG